MTFISAFLAAIASAMAGVSLPLLFFAASLALCLLLSAALLGYL
jgi:hypothetical protein